VNLSILSVIIDYDQLWLIIIDYWSNNQLFRILESYG